MELTSKLPLTHTKNNNIMKNLVEKIAIITFLGIILFVGAKIALNEVQILSNLF